MSRIEVEAETSQCQKCIHCNEIEFNCKAFPFGIPEDILRNEILHDEVLPEQFGVAVFEEA